MIRRSISEIMAVIMLVIVVIAAVAAIYAWISGLLGAARGSAAQAATLKLQITSASISPDGNVTVQILNPPGGSPDSVSLVIVTFTNYSMICYGSGPELMGTLSVSPGSVATVYFTCRTPLSIPGGTPVVITVFTASGAWYQWSAKWPG